MAEAWWNFDFTRTSTMGVKVEPHVGTGAWADGEPVMMADMTAVVCTRNRAVQLERSLDSLLAQEWVPREILVVDNAPADESTQRLLERRFAGVRYVREPVQGLDFARNRALREARCTLVAFVDDDALADTGWARAMMKAFDANAETAAIAGRVEALALETDAQRLFETNGGFSRGVDPIHLPADRNRLLNGRRVPLVAWLTRIVNGCNLVIRRDVALELGGFDVALDLGRVLPGGGDHDMVWRILQAGYDVMYLPDALVRHDHRREMRAVLDQLVGHQRALVAFLAKAAVQAKGSRRIPIIAFLGWRLVKPAVRLARRLVGRDPLSVSVLLRLWVHSLRGVGAYPAARRTARRRVAAARVST